ncbi:MAG: DegT/DnrJ/EryC1/StrS family aminotransferase [Deltaproteobacteria bacterium]|nr:DegT/DnrJ/EryC1/StrS family aminotransferase [Deltaproteobacteria bacterium]
MVDLQRQYANHKAEIDAAIARVLETSGFIKGAEVSAFEAGLGAYLGVDHVIGCGSGTDALQIAYMALCIGPGDEVITTPFTFVATVEALVLLGAKPVYVDIDPHTYNLDVSQVHARITPRTRAIVPVHLYGQPADMDPLLELAKQHNIVVIEDNAQAIGARYKGRMTGTMGALGCFSFFPAKNLGCFGDGGAIATNDAKLAEQCRLIANHGSKTRYFHELVGINSRLDTLQAAVLMAKLPHLDSFNEGRCRVAKRYDQAFANAAVTTPWVAPYAQHVYQQYSIRCADRARLISHLEAAEVPYAIHYPRPLHQQPAFARLVPEGQRFPHAEQAAAQILSLPLFPEMTEDEVDQVIRAVVSFS